MNYWIIPLSQARARSVRIDAEHYHATYLANQKKLSDLGATPLKNLVSMPVVTGHTPTMDNDSYYGGHIRFIKTDNLREFSIGGGFSHHLSDSGNDVIRRSKLEPKDLIVTIIGAAHKIVGRAALVRDKDLPANINQNIALIRLKEHESPEFLSAYLNSIVGRRALWYLSRQTEQVNLNCREVEDVLVPQMSSRFIRTIESSYNEAIQFEDDSERAFAEAQSLLLAELNLADWQHKSPPSFFTNFSATWSIGRVDADYFQPKYDEIIAAIKDYSGGWDTLGNLVHLRTESFMPAAAAEYKYIELAHVGASGAISGCLVAPGADLPSRARRKVSMDDVIVSSVEGSLDSIALVDSEYDGAICSTGFHVMNATSLNSETLLVMLKSIVGQSQLKRGCNGTILTAINLDAVKQIVLPVASKKAQTQVQQLVAKSTALRQASVNLFRRTKQAVEMAIEQDEHSAIAWLDQLPNPTRG